MTDQYWTEQANRNNWIGSTRHHETLVKQGLEVATDLFNLKAKSYLDVGGAAGRIGDLLKDKALRAKRDTHYKCIDLENGFDLLKDWTEQGLDKKFDVVFTSLTLLCFSEQEVEFITGQMKKFAKKYIYLFEEQSISKLPCGVMVASDKNHKYNHLWANHFWPIQSREDSKIIPDRWERITVKL